MTDANRPEIAGTNGAELRQDSSPPALRAGCSIFNRSGEAVARLKGLPKRLAAAPRVVGYSDRQSAERARNRARASGNSLRPLYSSKRWRDLRLVVLERAGWMCQGCAEPHLLSGKHPAPHSPVVDHIEPHRGNLMLFWDESNLQAVCKAWHDSEKQRQEKAARPDGTGEGWF